jgi:hypothetical protein
MSNRGWSDDFEHVGFNGTVTTAIGGVQIPTGTGNWIAQSVVSQGQVLPVDGEPGTNGIIELRSGTTADSQLVFYKGLKPTVGDPTFGVCPAQDIRCMVFRMRIPGSFADNMGFRLTLTNRPIFPDAAGESIGFFYDHDTTPGGTSDPLVHTKTRSVGSPELDTPCIAPTPGAWVDFVISQETPGEIKFYMGATLVATHTGPSVPDMGALMVSAQVFNRTSGAKKIHLDVTTFRPVDEIDVPECASIYERACALSEVNGVYVVGKGADFYPNILEATQAINASGNPPSAINRTCIYVMPGQYTQAPPPAPPVAIPAFVGVKGFSFTLTELLNARFVHAGEQIFWEDLFITTAVGADFATHFDLAGYRIANFTRVQHLSHLPLIRQSGANWYTMGLKDVGSTYLGDGSKGYAIEWVNTGDKRNCDVYHQLFACDVWNLESGQIGPNGAGAVRAVDVQDLRAMQGEVRVNNFGICWKLEGASKTDLVQFVNHRCNNRFAGNFPNAKSIVSDSLKVQIDNCSLPRCTTPGSAIFNPAPENSYVTYV